MKKQNNNNQHQSDLEIIFKALPDLYFRLDKKGKILDYRAGNIADLYLPPEEFINKKIKDIFPSTTSSRIMKAVKDSLRNNKLSQIEYSLQISGETKYFEARLLPTENKEVISIIRNITEQKLSQQRLEKSRVLLDESQHLTHICSFEYNMQTESVVWSKEAYAILGVKPDTFEYSNDILFQIIHPEDRDDIRQIINNNIANHEPIDYECRFIKQDSQEVRFLRCRANVTYDKDSTPIAIIGTTQDITSKKLAEKKLLDREELYRTLFELSPDAIVVSDLDAKIKYVNRQTQKLFNLDTKDDVKGKTTFSYVVPEDREKINQDALNAIESGKIIDVRYTFLRKDGTTFLGESSASIILDNEGNPTGFIGIIKDITQREKTEKDLELHRNHLEELVEDKISELHYSEQKYKTLVETIDDIIYTIDVEGKFTYANPKSEELTGYSSEEVIGRSFTGLIVPEYLKTTVENFKKAISGKHVPPYETAVICKDGTVIYLELKISTLTDSFGKIIGRLGVGRDITQRKRNEQELEMYRIRLEDLVEERTIELKNEIFERQQTEDELRKLSRVTQQSNSHVVITDKSGLITYVNPAFEKVTGYSFDEVIGKNTRILKSGKHNQEFYKEMWDIILSGKTYKNILINKTKTGKLYYEGKTISPLKNANGEITHFVSTGNDITQKIKDDEAIRESEKHLQTIFDTAQAGIFVIDEKDHTVVDINSAAVKLIGAPKDKIVGSVCHEYICPAERGKCPISNLGQAIDNSERILLNIDGKKIPILKTVTTATIKGRKCLIESFVDISNLKRIEKSLRLSEEKYRTVIDLTTQGFYLVDSNQRISEVNNAFCDLIDFNREEIIGRRLTEFVTDKSRNLMNLEIEKNPIASHRRFDVVLEKKDGEEIYTILNSAIIYSKSGQENGGFGFFDNITKRKSAEEALRKLSSRLQTLQEEERTNIAREIHDELGQNLTGMKMDLAWLKSKVPDNHNLPVYNKFDSLEKLVNQTINDVRRISSELRPSILDDLGLIAAIEWHIKEYVQRTEIHCKLHLPDDDSWIDTKRSTALFRMLQESLTNVARHSEATEVSIKLTKETNKLILDISDNGLGIDEEIIFNHKSLGLLGMRERANIWGGTVTISGKMDIGTFIHVEIPYNEKELK